MRFTVSFEVDKDALADPALGQDEITEVLESVARIIQIRGADPGDRVPVHDISGNRIGEWRLTKR